MHCHPGENNEPIDCINKQVHRKSCPALLVSICDYWELVILLGGAGVAFSFYQRFCSWGWGVGANLVHCHSKAIQVPITLTKLRSIGYRQACMNLRGEEVFPCKSADLLSFPGCGLVDCMFTAHSDEQPVLCNHNVPFTGQPTILRNNLCRKFYIFSPATPSCKTQRTS